MGNEVCKDNDDNPDIWDKTKDYVDKRMTMEGLLSQAKLSLQHYLDPKIIATEERMSKEVLLDAKAIVFITEAKGGLFVGIKGGSGIILFKKNNKWSPPCAIGSGGISFGLLVGAAKIDHIIILSTDEQINVFLCNGQLQLKGNFNATIGKWGRNIEGGGAVGTNTMTSKIFIYSFGVKGIYNGLSLDGEVLCIRKDCNQQFYKKYIDVKQILMGKISMPHYNKDYNRIIELLNGFGAEQDDENNNDNDCKYIVPKQLKSKQDLDDIHHCICDEQLFKQTIYDNIEEIICDNCLETLCSETVVYRCLSTYNDWDDPMHRGGFDLCISCMEQLDYDSFIDISNNEKLKMVDVDPINDQIQQFKTAFSAVGIDGEIDMNELNNIFPHLSYIEIVQFMNHYDTNHDGKLDFKEYCVFLKKFVLGMDAESDVDDDEKKKLKDNYMNMDRKTLFDSFAVINDYDKTSFIKNDGLINVMKHLGIKNANITEIMNEFDDDKNGKIDFNEFCEILNVYQHKNDFDDNLNDNEFQKHLFNRFDDDGNGILDNNELCILLSILGKDGYKYIDIQSLINKFDKGRKGGVNFEEFKKLYQELNELKHINKSNHNLLRDNMQNSKQEWIMMDIDNINQTDTKLNVYNDENHEQKASQINGRFDELNKMRTSKLKQILQKYTKEELSANCSKSDYIYLIIKFESEKQIIYNQQQAVFEKVMRFEKHYQSKSIKLNVAISKCVKKLLFGVQCYIAEEITNEKASMFDKIVDTKRKAKRWINSKINWDNKKVELILELSKLLSKIALNCMCPGAACIAHFVEAGTKYDNNDKKGAYLSIALGIGCIVTAGLSQYIESFGDFLWNALLKTDFIADNLEFVIKQIAELLQPLCTEYLKDILPFINEIHNKLGEMLVDIGIKETSKLYEIIMKGAENITVDASVTIDELIKAETNDVLDVHLTKEVQEVFTQKIDDFVEDTFGKSYDDMDEAIDDAKDTVIEFGKEKIIEDMNKNMDEMKDKVRIFVMEQLNKIYKTKGVNNINGKKSSRKIKNTPTKINDIDILNDKHCILNDIGIFIKNIDWKNVGKHQLSETKLFNKNGDAMIYIAIERSLEEYEQFYIKKQYELCARTHCIVMFAGNEEAKRQLLMQKLMK